MKKKSFIKSATTLWFYDRTSFFRHFQAQLRLKWLANIVRSVLTRRYARRSGCEQFINQLDARIDTKTGVPYELFLSSEKRADVSRLAFLALKQPIGDILEFGSGVSTLILAFCCQRNDKKYGHHGFVHCLEADLKWQKVVERELERHDLTKYVKFHHSTPRITNYDTTPVMSFDTLPNVQPNFVFVDGPRWNQAVGSFKGILASASISCLDLLFYEATFPAHTKIIIDGKLNFVKFYEKNLKRTYRQKVFHLFDQTEFKLKR